MRSWHVYSTLQLIKHHFLTLASLNTIKRDYFTEKETEPQNEVYNRRAHSWNPGQGCGQKGWASKALDVQAIPRQPDIQWLIMGENSPSSFPGTYGHHL